MFCLRFAHYRDIARLEGELAWERRKSVDLEAKIVVLENQVAMLQQYLLPPPVTGVNTPGPAMPTTVDKLKAARNARDFSKIAEHLENQAVSAT